MKIIGIGGKKRAGKSTLADYIIRAAAARGMVTEEISFAQPIKEMMQELFRYEVPYSTFVDDDRKQNKVEVATGVFMTVREILQKVGTECFRDVIHRDFWVSRGIAKIKGSSVDLVVVPDVRFENELKALKKIGRTIYIEKLSELILPIDTHPSEMELDRIMTDFDDFISVPEGGTDTIKDMAEEIVARL